MKKKGKKVLKWKSDQFDADTSVFRVFKFNRVFFPFIFCPLNLILISKCSAYHTETKKIVEEKKMQGRLDFHD